MEVEGLSMYSEDGATVCGWMGWGSERKRGIKDAEVWGLSNWEGGTAIFEDGRDRRGKRPWVGRSGIQFPEFLVEYLGERARLETGTLKSVLLKCIESMTLNETRGRSTEGREKVTGRSPGYVHPQTRN